MKNEVKITKSVRTVRFDKKDLQKIEEFLKQNSFLDFSSLARISINNFIENPTVQIKPLNNSQQIASKKGDQHVST